MATSRFISEARDKHITSLRYVILGLIVTIVLLVIALTASSKTQRMFVPPSFDEGGRLTANQVPDVYAYQFSLALWKKMNVWESDGAKEFPENIYKYQNYFTAGCRETLESQFYALRRKGELKDRKRAMVESPESPYSASKVQKAADGVWNVDLDVILRESVGNTQVKNNLMHYPIRVVYYDIDVDLNPWGLAIDCFYDQPTLVKNNIVKEGGNG